MSEKKILRNTIHGKISGLSDEEIEEKSRRIAENLAKTEYWKEAEVILCFISMGKEVDTTPIFEIGFSQGKEMAVPRVRGREMDFHLIEHTEGPWEEHPFGMLEPHGSMPVIHPKICPDRKVLIISPGLAFDREANRLGRGGGFYDRYLDNPCENVFTLGICFSEQLTEQVPMDPHDLPLDGVVTESEIILNPKHSAGNH